MTENFKGILAACVTAFLWGCLAVAMKVALQYVSPIPIVWFRFALAASVLLAYFLVRNPKPLKAILKSFPILLFFAATLLGYNYLGYIMGLHYTTPATAQVVIQIGPILLTLSGIFLFKEKVNKMQLFGFAIATVGLVLFYYNQLVGITTQTAYNIGFLWILSAAVAWTCYAIFQKKLVQKYDTQLLNLFIYGIPAILFLPVVDFQEFQGLAAWQWVLLIFLGLNTLVAYGCLALAFKYTEAYKVSIIVTLNPIITLVAMTVFYYFQVSWIAGEKLSLASIIGALLLLGGATIAVYFSRKK